MFSNNLGRALAIASALLLSACKTFSPDGGMSTVAAVAGGGLDKSVVRINSAEDASLARSEVARLLHGPLGADAAVQIALLNNAGLQAAYNRLGVAEAVMVQMSRPPLPSFSYDWVKTSIELDTDGHLRGLLGVGGHHLVQPGDPFHPFRHASFGKHPSLGVHHAHVVVGLRPVDPDEDHASSFPSTATSSPEENAAP